MDYLDEVELYERVSLGESRTANYLRDERARSCAVRAGSAMIGRCVMPGCMGTQVHVESGGCGCGDLLCENFVQETYCDDHCIDAYS